MTSKMTILVIDDDLSVRSSLENFFSGEYEIVSMENGYEALTWCSSGNKADMLLINIDLPMLNSFELAECIRRKTEGKDLPVIALQNKEQAARRIRSSNSNMKDYLLKPFNPEELSSRINTLLEKR